MTKDVEHSDRPPYDDEALSLMAMQHFMPCSNPPYATNQLNACLPTTWLTWLGTVFSLLKKKDPSSQWSDIDHVETRSFCMVLQKRDLQIGNNFWAMMTRRSSTLSFCLMSGVETLAGKPKDRIVILICDASPRSLQQMEHWQTWKQ